LEKRSNAGTNLQKAWDHIERIRKLEQDGFNIGGEWSQKGIRKMTETTRYFEAIRWTISAWVLWLAASIVPNHGMYTGSLAEAAEYAGQRVRDCLNAK